MLELELKLASAHASPACNRLVQQMLAGRLPTQPFHATIITHPERFRKLVDSATSKGFCNIFEISVSNRETIARLQSKNSKIPRFSEDSSTPSRQLEKLEFLTSYFAGAVFPGLWKLTPILQKTSVFWSFCFRVVHRDWRKVEARAMVAENAKRRPSYGHKMSHHGRGKRGRIWETANGFLLESIDLPGKKPIASSRS